ncbi:uncharacterized protein EV420DRAFT_87824 [Desarmillaria tabescens]|uniref:Uncharacterized protein n=1 Tax=Armillaria tabescens TaxID=1929756 RepID=A0AA39NR95_ARMTA|nr:uncharacterized protein EV420DRAFT_87824 [Desarmillaria tabescens]KAK0470063.1 hypothetical protein EV420DRAFT_87824 [Desarmillaria tabescens]
MQAQILDLCLCFRMTTHTTHMSLWLTLQGYPSLLLIFGLIGLVTEIKASKNLLTCAHKNLPRPSPPSFTSTTSMRSCTCLSIAITGVALMPIIALGFDPELTDLQFLFQVGAIVYTLSAVIGGITSWVSGLVVWGKCVENEPTCR